MNSELRFPITVAFVVLAIAVASGMLTLFGSIIIDGQVATAHTALRIRRIWFGDRPEISVITASYGLNCRNFPEPKNIAKRTNVGNVTTTVKQVCDGRQQCNFVVDISKIGDPANNCGKEFSVDFLCSNSSAIKTAFIPADADGKTTKFVCK